jgi:hypothetical protein
MAAVFGNPAGVPLGALENDPIEMIIGRRGYRKLTGSSRSNSCDSHDLLVPNVEDNPPGNGTREESRRPGLARSVTGGGQRLLGGSGAPAETMLRIPPVAARRRAERQSVDVFRLDRLGEIVAVR